MIFYTYMPEPRSLGKNKNSNDHVHDKCLALTIEKEGKKEHWSSTKTNERNEKMNFGVEGRSPMEMIVEEIAFYPKGQRARQSINAYKVIITLKKEKINRSPKKGTASAQRSSSLQKTKISSECKHQVKYGTTKVIGWI